MSIIYANKEINVNEINCDDSLRVTLSLTAEPDITTNAADIVLLVDRSCCLAGTPLSLLKESLYQFIDQIAAATNSAESGTIGNGSRIALVSFAGEAKIDVPLTNSVERLKEAVDALTTGCNSNHYAAFSTATEVLNDECENRKIIVLFTVSHNTIGADPEIATEAAKEAGIIIYGIGVTGLGGLETERLKTWVSQPNDTHAFITDALTELNDLFREVAEDIIGSGATEIIVNERINPDFEITDILTPNYGTVRKESETHLIWSISALGLTERQEAVLEFYIRHTATTSGVKEVNESITYSDAEGNTVTFPSPRVDVINCECPEHEHASITLEVNAGSCREYLLYSAEENDDENQLDVNVVVRNLNPSRELTLRVILIETRNGCIEEQRDIQTFVIYPTNCSCSSCNTNAVIRDFDFTLPATENQLKLRLSAQYNDK